VSGCTRIQILTSAQADLLDGFWFYENQTVGIGQYFLDSLSADIDALLIYAGIHTAVSSGALYRGLASRFPYAFYYRLDNDCATVIAVLDTRRNPIWLRKKLQYRQ
jgi:plasmid stabilization system protein ParE